MVEGPTLEDRIKGGAIPVEESLRLALQIAEALEAAHEKGVIHRDLKPANIKVTDDGKVKVLDFGLAKAFEGDAAESNLSQSPTLSMAATQQGIILGTAAYMSPEQAKGRATDRRADIWAFGCVLYEMLTGKPAFDGEDVSEILASVIKATTNLDRLPPETDPALRRVIARCLEKDLHRRFRDIGDVQFELEGILVDSGGVRMEETRPVATAEWRKPVPWVVAVVGILASVFVTLQLRPEEPREPARFVVSPDLLPVAVSGLHANVAISADGRSVAYHTPSDDLQQIYVRPLDSLEGVVLDADPRMESPFFSPSGDWIAYGSIREDGLRRVRIVGGGAETVATWNGYAFRGGDWGDDDVIVFASGVLSSLMEVPAVGGEPEPITTPNGENLTSGRRSCPAPRRSCLRSTPVEIGESQCSTAGRVRCGM